jgi:hypothetical protein
LDAYGVDHLKTIRTSCVGCNRHHKLEFAASPNAAAQTGSIANLSQPMMKSLLDWTLGGATPVRPAAQFVGQHVMETFEDATEAYDRGDH